MPSSTRQQHKQTQERGRRRYKNTYTPLLHLRSRVLFTIQLVSILQVVFYHNSHSSHNIVEAFTQPNSSMNLRFTTLRHVQGNIKRSATTSGTIRQASFVANKRFVGSTSQLMMSIQRNTGIGGSYIYSHSHNRNHAHNNNRFSFNLQAAASSSSKTNDGEEKKKKGSTTKSKKRKIKLADPSKVDLDALTNAFDEMAKKDGFDESTAFLAKDSTFEDDFGDDDFLDMGDYEGDEDDDDFLDFGGGDEVESMESRIANAQRDMDMGRVSVSEELDAYSAKAELKKLGFKQELNPFGNDETPRKESFKIITNAMTCSACGAKFQTQAEARPGFLPLAKYETQVKLSKIEEVQRIQEKAQSDEWTPEDEVEWLIQTDGSADPREGEGIDVEAMARELDLDLVELTREKKTICKRCHGLQNFGEAPEMLRPGWTDEPALSQEKFRNLLLPLKEKPAVIVALVDLFDFSGSILPELDEIAGENPVIIAANKADLLPSKMGQARAENWVRRELEYLGIRSIANIGGAVRLVSCKTGFGVSQMLSKARGIAEDMECDIYVVGAANAGKSTLINHIMAKNDKTDKKKKGKKRPGNANAIKGAVTASPLPGTTLEFIKLDIGNGQTLYDTPGLLVPSTVTTRLTPAELKMVVPRKQVEPITFRIASGKCVLIGGLARIEVIGDSKPFMFTFFVSNDIKLHPTDAARADEFVAKHAGKMLTPPLEPGPERIEQLGEFEYHDIEIDGAGWKEAAADISLRGVGWIAVTGAGTAKVRVSVPKGIGFSVRPPLMPFDVWEATAKYTGGRAVRKSTKTKAGKRNKGVGRR